MLEFEFHPDMLLILPALAVSHGTCGDANCTADHWRLPIGWLIGSIHLYF